MSARTKLITGQAGVVTILIAIAYFVFLKGDDPGALSGIDAPGGDRVQVEAPDGDTGKPRLIGNQPSRPGGDRAGGVGIGPGAPPASGPAERPTSRPSPSDDQYSDTVRGLEAKLESGGTSINGP